MNRRQFLHTSVVTTFSTVGILSTGCPERQHAHIVHEGEQDIVGSHCAGSATYGPLVEGAVAKLLGRHVQDSHVQATGGGVDARKRVVFVGIENKSIEEMGDFKDHLTETIENKIEQSEVYGTVSRRYVQVGLQTIGCQPSQLFLPAHQRSFLSVMEQQGMPVDYLLFATLTSGTTQRNKSTQRDYMLTLELVNVHTGDHDKESQKIRKGYHKSRLGERRNYHPRRSNGR